MKLIGLYLWEKTYKSHRKILTEGWYPLVGASAPIYQPRYIPPRLKDSIPASYFNIYETLPNINISCIVGLNGSGKSTLVELILKIIDNFSIAVFSGEGDDELLKINEIPGIFADLYLQIENKTYRICNNDSEIKLNVSEGDGEGVWEELYNLSYKESIETLSRLCFTICLNYGLHSFNPNSENSFDDNRKKLKFDRWFDRVFHRVDDYSIPMTIVPSRNDGIIDINNENKLTKQRVAAISLLLYSKGQRSILNDYSPRYIRYALGRLNDDTVKKQYANFLKSNTEDDFPTKYLEKLEKLLPTMQDEWKIQLAEIFDRIALHEDIRLSYVNYLAFKSLKISLIHDSYKSKVWKHVFENDKNAESLCSYLIGQILTDDSYVTAKIHATLNMLESDVYEDKVYGKVYVDDILKDTHVESYNDIVKLLPPSCFYYECYYSRNEKNDLSIDSFSSGERQMLFSFSAVLYHLANISTIPKNDENRIPYHHVNLIFDEIELYFHPEYQRIMVRQLLKGIEKLGLDKDEIKSINILMVTHSPYILSDIPTPNVLYLGRKARTIPKTFGANIFDVLKDGFFMEGAMGSIVTGKIRYFMDVYYQTDENLQKREFCRHRHEFKFLAESVEDEYLKRVLRRFYDSLDRKYDYIKR